MKKVATCHEARARGRALPQIVCIGYLALATLGRLAGALRLVATSVSLALSDTAVEAVVGVGGLVAVVGVDAHKLATAVGSGSLHVNGTGAVARAVTA